MDYEFKTLKLLYDTPIKNTVTLIFSRPDALNALNAKMIEELNLVINDIEYNQEKIKAVIVTGEGKAFVAGADISEMVKLSPVEARNFLHNAQQVLNRLEALPIPVIAKINGYALGGGLEVALACDIRIASDNSVLGLPEVSLGIIPAAGGTQRLTRLIGVGRSKYLIMMAKKIDAKTAYDLGIVSEVVPLDKLDDTILKTLNELYNLAPIAVSGAKKAIEAALNENIRAGLEFELDRAVRCFQSQDLREGMTAFLEKRKANFKGV